jgi:hemolysin III
MIFGELLQETVKSKGKMPTQQNPQHHQETSKEEMANSISHGIGMLLSIAGLVLFMLFAAGSGNGWQIVSLSIFGSTLILLYLASTLYHGLPLPRVKHAFKIIDHSAIFLLIAGTYTPFMLGNLRGPWGWSILGIIWALAILGILMKIIYISKFRKISVVLYVFMGWLAIIAFKEIIAHVPPLSLTLLVLGGFSYTTGLVFYAWRKLPFNHLVWHIFVIGGSTFHYLAVWYTL